MNPRVLRLVVMLVPCLFADPTFAADRNKILHVASTSIETLDPQRYNDDPSYQIQFAIFEGLYEWDYLASPSRLTPNTATAMPAITDDGRTWIIRVKSGIHFTDDPAFKGKRRELVAEDYVYSLKRVLDPGMQRGGNPVETDLIVGARAVVDAASKPGGKFDYDKPVEGLRALDRYTLQLKLIGANYPVVENLIANGAVAREVVEAADGDVRTRAVGTGPYRLKEWKQGSRMVLEANPDYRVLGFPESRDPAYAALTASMRGITLPQIGTIEIAFIDEATTLSLEFERGMLDYVALGAIREHGTLDVPLPPAPPIFRFADTGECARALSQAGFAAPGTASLQLIWQTEDPQAILELIYKSVVRTPMVLRAQTEEARARIHEAIIAGAEHYRTQGVIHLRFPAVLATAVAA